jgi:hypothetical protein
VRESRAFPPLRIEHIETADDRFDGAPIVSGYADDGVFWACAARRPCGRTLWRRIHLIQPEADKPAAELPPPHRRMP